MHTMPSLLSLEISVNYGNVQNESFILALARQMKDILNMQPVSVRVAWVTVGMQFHRDREWFGLEGTVKAPLSPSPAMGRDSSH